MHVHVSTSLA